MTLSDKQLLPHIVLLSKKLIAIPSTADNKQELQKVLETAKKELEGYFPIEEFDSNGISSLLVHNKNKRTKHFKIILNAHLDVVPGKKEQFKPFEKNGKLYGRGAYDTKAAGAIMLILFKELAKKVTYPLGLQLVTDEEIGGYNGTLYQAQKKIFTDFLLLAEPSDLRINNAAKGVFWLKVAISGTSQHAAYPWRGKNAIIKLQNFSQKLERLYPTPITEKWATTISLTRIETANQATNVIPDNCIGYFDIRYIPSEKETIIGKIKEIIPDDFLYEIQMFDSPVNTPLNNPYLTLLEGKIGQVTKKPVEFIVTHGSSDGRHYAELDCDSICFGPIGNGHHSDTEWVDTKSLEDYYHILKNFLLSVK